MGLLSGITGGIFGSKAAKKNKGDAAYFAEQTKWAPGNLWLGNGTQVSWGKDGKGVAAHLGPQQQAIQDSLFGMSSNAFGNLAGLLGSGGINPMLANNMSAYDAMMPSGSLAGLNPSLANVQAGLPATWFGDGGALQQLAQGAGGVAQALQGQAANPTQLSTTLGDQFNAASGGFLGGLGSFDPNQAAQDYTSLLRQQAQPAQDRAAQNLAQQLFNSGRLGSTGGQGLLGELINQQNQQDLAFQQAGRDYAGQEQNRIAGLAQSLGNTGTGINQSMAALNDQLASGALGRYGSALGIAQGADQFGFDRLMGLNQAQFDRGLTMNDMAFDRAVGLNEMGFERGNLRAQQRFQNAMQTFGAGQQNLATQMGLGTGLLGSAQGFDQDMLNAIMSSANIEGLRTGVQNAAYNPLFQASVARNNAQAAGWIGAVQGFENDARYLNDNILSFFGAGKYGGGGGGGGGMMSGMGSMFGGMMGGMGGGAAAGGGGAAIAAMSDRDLKENIRFSHNDGKYNWYKYNYKGDDKEWTGVMADEVEKINPDAVFMVNGYKAVNYGVL